MLGNLRQDCSSLQEEPIAGSSSSSNKQERIVLGIKAAGLMICPRPNNIATHPGNQQYAKDHWQLSVPPTRPSSIAAQT